MWAGQGLAGGLNSGPPPLSQPLSPTWPEGCRRRCSCLCPQNWLRGLAPQALVQGGLLPPAAPGEEPGARCPWGPARSRCLSPAGREHLARGLAAQPLHLGGWRGLAGVQATGTGSCPSGTQPSSPALRTASGLCPRPLLCLAFPSHLSLVSLTACGYLPPLHPFSPAPQPVLHVRLLEGETARRPRPC